VWITVGDLFAATKIKTDRLEKEKKPVQAQKTLFQRSSTEKFW